ncbi:MAG: beta-glucosidase [Sedimentisphaerales bacterium]|nr:beta-glucosidase [Sedimentisphaerales bacterium]
MTFPEMFHWGVATAAYQIEGAANLDGKGLSVWDMMCRRPGAVFENHNGEVACDHYHRFREDVAIMKELGVKAYRLSISWPRVLPEGIGKVNDKGMAFYHQLIDSLRENDIEPFVTLFHWDYPQTLFQRGGWLNPDSSNWFAEYTRVVIDALSDRVNHWITLNEPQCFIGLGHYRTEHAPGLSLTLPDVLKAAHHVLLSHGKAVQTIRQYSKQPTNIGYAPVGDLAVPDDETAAADVDAAREETFSIKPGSFFNSVFWMDPILLGHYPEQSRESYGLVRDDISDADMAIIREPIDFLGVNIYNARRVTADQKGKPQILSRPAGYWQTAMDWPVEPTALYWGPKFFHERYNIPIIITENGMANQDCVSADGRVHDPQRIEFLRRYLRQLGRAYADGVKVQGYFIWSLLDNFEWAYGYSKRFGIVYIDYATQQRICKDSAYWYKQVIATNGAILDNSTDG